MLEASGSNLIRALCKTAFLTAGIPLDNRARKMISRFADNYNGTAVNVAEMRVSEWVRSLPIDPGTGKLET
jgi:hypothetical protein